MCLTSQEPLGLGDLCYPLLLIKMERQNLILLYLQSGLRCESAIPQPPPPTPPKPTASFIFSFLTPLMLLDVCHGTDGCSCVSVVLI